ncbi:MAG: hypothetical protein IT262_05670 [Saprospiraceae bacterium]|nr:hypothetical protein [Saprospiraceae bacterium]
MSTLIKLGLFLLVGILVYNRFFGTNEEQQQSKEVFKKTGDALGAAWNMLKSEKQKFDGGKYDKVLDQLGSAYRAVRSRAQYVDEKVLQRLDDLERRKASLEEQLDSIQDADAAPSPPPTKKGAKADAKAEQIKAGKAADQQRRKEALQRELDELMKDTDQLLKEAQEK